MQEILGAIGYDDVNVKADKRYDWAQDGSCGYIGKEENFGKNQTGVNAPAGWKELPGTATSWTHNTTNESYEFNITATTGNFLGQLYNDEWYRSNMCAEITLSRKNTESNILFNFRTDNGNNGYRITVFKNTEEPNITLYSVTGGATTALGTKKVTFANGTIYKLAVTAEGDLLRVYLDDVMIIEANNSDYDSGSFNLGIRANTSPIDTNLLTVYNMKLKEFTLTI